MNGNLSRCTGCGNRNLRADTGKPHPPPYDLCLQHKEYVMFENPLTGRHQLSTDLRNVYYHALKRCVILKYPNFNPSSDLKVSRVLRSLLSATHLNFIMHEFGLSVLNA